LRVFATVDLVKLAGFLFLSSFVNIKATANSSNKEVINNTSYDRGLKTKTHN